MINIVVATNEKWIEYAKVMITSLSISNKNNNINVNLFYYEKSINKHLKDIRKILKRNKHILTPYQVPDEIFKQTIATPSWPRDTFLKWSCLDLLPQNIERCLVLDVDTIVKDDIKSFYFQDMQDFWFTSSLDMNLAYSNISTIGKKHLEEMKTWNVKRDENYYNSGAVLVNLAQIRKKENKENQLTFNKFMEIYTEYKFNCIDQDVINYPFNDKIKKSDCLKYNYMPNFNFEQFKDKEFYPNAKIVHFAGGDIKRPWNYSPKNKKFTGAKDWWHYAWLSGRFFQLYIKYRKHKKANKR